jgi:Domain of unknown function (DUF397)
METSGALSWRKSSYSTSNGGNCVEVGTAPCTIAVRDSKAPHGPVLAVSREGWQDFTRRVKTATAHH